VLSDTDSQVIRRYGLLNESIDKSAAQYGIPYPATFILDPSGVVVQKYFEKDFRQRYTASEILVRQYGDAAGAAGQTVDTKHLRLTTSASLSAVHWGQRLALVADIQLKPGMHVYAPGVQGYIPIEFSVKPTAAFEAHAPAYPPSRDLRLKAIGETVPVYQNRFRIAADITIAPDAQVKPLLSQAGDLTVEGSLRYQACDAKVCYAPETVPLKWTFHYEALDRQRAPSALQRQTLER
jgi:DsbC/DsbD-like thiol-disulfide interchange protein